MARTRTLRQMRIARGLTPTEAADLIGITRQQLYNLETGRGGTTSATLGKICRAYGYPPAEVLAAVERSAAA